MKSFHRVLLIYWVAFFALYIFYCYSTMKDEYKDSVKVKGIVVQMLIGKGRRSYYEYPQIRFVYRDSTRYIADHKVAGRKVGDQVTLIFQKDRPEEARVYNFFRYWGNLPVLIVSALVAIFVFFICAVIFTKSYPPG